MRCPKCYKKLNQINTCLNELLDWRSWRCPKCKAVWNEEYVERYWEKRKKEKGGSKMILGKKQKEYHKIKGYDFIPKKDLTPAEAVRCAIFFSTVLPLSPEGAAKKAYTNYLELPKNIKRHIIIIYKEVK